MNKRDTIQVVFRVIAIFMLFFIVALLPEVVAQWSRTAIVPTSLSEKLISSIFIIGIPAGAAYLLWSRSDWIADKILAPFGMDELWVDEVPVETESSEIIEGETVQEAKPEILVETTITHLNRKEIEEIILTAVSIIVLINSVPDLLRMLYLLSADAHPSWGWLIPSLGRTLLASWLFFRVNNLSSWLGRWKKYRME